MKEEIATCVLLALGCYLTFLKYLCIIAYLTNLSCEKNIFTCVEMKNDNLMRIGVEAQLIYK